MTNNQIAEALGKLAFFSAINGEDSFKVRAYLNASKNIRQCFFSIADMVERGEDLTQINGIGKIIAKKINELVLTKHLKSLENLLGLFPESLYELSRIKGIGPKTAYKFFINYQIKSLDDLKCWLNNGNIPDVSASVLDKIKAYFSR